ncbi:DNA-binding response regulator, OmpR family, contains REC and winged-helix (wHTH) domain [Lachnospiraceae bacterium NLAE-zl-G231]|nr:DNA-binding response regulator, OmpR family, contains REC and winged-helix (wHTH) domain [Lachnospiraceae bacterium NLAE-zl-G231]
MKNKILVIEDDADINTLLKKILERAGYEAETAFSGTEGRLLLKLNTYDLVLLDLMLPGLSGEELLTEIRKTLRMPVIALTAKAGLSDKVNVLGSGADDYITKPFEKQELLARIQAQLRRAGDYSAVQADASSPQKLTCRDLELYPENHRVLLRGEEIPLTTHEFLLLQLLMANPQKVFSRENLYQSVWNSDFYGEDNAVSVHISNIRKKLAALTDEEYIQTVWGIGYKINL